MRWITYFFFSSRRRHTRCLSDWSSDVCSSDLNGSSTTSPGRVWYSSGRSKISSGFGEIGRASCRERGQVRVDDVRLKQKRDLRTAQADDARHEDAGADRQAERYEWPE